FDESNDERVIGNGLKTKFTETSLDIDYLENFLVATSRLLKSLQGCFLVLSMDLSRLISGTRDGSIRFWSLLHGSENYSSWRRSLMIALNAKNKLKIITNDYPEPDDSPIRALWERNNDMIISWILNTVSDQISNNLSFVHSASALWLEL
ncbi:cysteine-rich receptor-like protein kinase 8, partial [Tanacetum coccineum]